MQVSQFTYFIYLYLFISKPFASHNTLRHLSMAQQFLNYLGKLFILHFVYYAVTANGISVEETVAVAAEQPSLGDLCSMSPLTEKRNKHTNRNKGNYLSLGIPCKDVFLI